MKKILDHFLILFIVCKKIAFLLAFSLPSCHVQFAPEGTFPAEGHVCFCIVYPTAISLVASSLCSKYCNSPLLKALDNKKGTPLCRAQSMYERREKPFFSSSTLSALLCNSMLRFVLKRQKLCWLSNFSLSGIEPSFHDYDKIGWLLS